MVSIGWAWARIGGVLEGYYYYYCILEGIDGDEDGADVGVDVIAQVAHARVVQQRGVRQVQQRRVVALVHVGRVGRKVSVGLELVAFGSDHRDVPADQAFELRHHEDIWVLRVLRSTGGAVRS